MAAFVKYGQLQIRIRNSLRDRQHPLEAFHGFVRAENHPVTLARQVQNVRLLSGELQQPVKHRLRSRDLEARPQGPTAVDQRDKVLGILACRLLK